MIAGESTPAISVRHQLDCFSVHPDHVALNLPEPSNMTPSTLTHVLYSFADVDPNSGNISLTDLYADEQVHISCSVRRTHSANTLLV